MMNNSNTETINKNTAFTAIIWATLFVVIMSINTTTNDARAAADPVVAVVNGTKITLSDIDRQIGYEISELGAHRRAGHATDPDSSP